MMAFVQVLRLGGEHLNGLQRGQGDHLSSLEHEMTEEKYSIGRSTVKHR